MNFYKECIEKEVYANRKLNPVQRYKIRTYNPAKNAVYLLRQYQYYAHKSGFLNNIFAKKYYKKLFSRYNIFLCKTTEIGKGLNMPHPTGIIFGEYARLGENCTVYQHVTVGTKHLNDYKDRLYPEIGNGCVLFAGACVLGKIEVGDGTTVGCNSVLTKSTPPNSTVVGNSRIL